MLCSMIKNVMPSACSSCSLSMMVASSVGFTPAPGSSSRISFGSATSTRASSSSFCWPPERFFANSPARLSSPTNWSTSRARARTARSWMRTRARANQLFQNLSPDCPAGASITFSSTVMPANGRGIWKVRTSPASKIRCGGCPPIGRPRNEIVPEVGRCTPAMVLNSVVLPAPFGPIRPVMVCADSVNDTPSTACKPPNSLTKSRTSSIVASCLHGRATSRVPSAWDRRDLSWSRARSLLLFRVAQRVDLRDRHHAGRLDLALGRDIPDLHRRCDVAVLVELQRTGRADVLDRLAFLEQFGGFLQFSDAGIDLLALRVGDLAHRVTDRGPRAALGLLHRQSDQHGRVVRVRDVGLGRQRTELGLVFGLEGRERRRLVGPRRGAVHVLHVLGADVDRKST